MPEVKQSKKSFTVLFVGILLIFLSLGWHFYDAARLSFAQSKGLTSNSIASPGAHPTFISIPRVRINLTVNETQIRDGIWEVNKDGVSHLSTSANPGTNGNIVLYAHNTNDRFGQIQWLQKGDIIYVTDITGELRSYTIKNTAVVSPSDTKILKKTLKETLTIYTCYGFADLKRFVVTALPV